MLDFSDRPERSHSPRSRCITEANSPSGDQNHPKKSYGDMTIPLYRQEKVILSGIRMTGISGIQKVMWPPVSAQTPPVAVNTTGFFSVLRTAPAALVRSDRPDFTQAPSASTEFLDRSARSAPSWAGILPGRRDVTVQAALTEEVVHRLSRAGTAGVGERASARTP